MKVILEIHRVRAINNHIRKCSSSYCCLLYLIVTRDKTVQMSQSRLHVFVIAAYFHDDDYNYL
jgi:hypothetical protein